LEHLDDEVREKLKFREANDSDELGKFERLLLQLTRQELSGSAKFTSESGFELVSNPFAVELPLGRYELPRKSVDAHAYRVGHDLAIAIIEKAKERPLPPVEIIFDVSGYQGKVSALEAWKRRSGVMVANWLALEATVQAEDHLNWAAVATSGEEMPTEVLAQLWKMPVQSVNSLDALSVPDSVKTILARQKHALLSVVQGRNAKYLDEESAKLDAWADDVKLALDRELKELDREIKEAKRAAKLEASLEGKLTQQRRAKALETTRNNKRKALFEAQDEVDHKREELLDTVEARLEQSATILTLFAVKWRIV
jgi:hypothetical protein